MNEHFDAVVLGGGFYGTTIAACLAQHQLRVLLVEREADLLLRASLHNQARVHNGYHYPRNFVTAYRSRLNLPVFCGDYPDAVVKSFTKLYALARVNSKVTPAQFERFCKSIEAPCVPATSAVGKLFNEKLIAGVYEVEEYALDANALRRASQSALLRDGVTVRLSTTATEVAMVNSRLAIGLRDAGNQQHSVSAALLFNATYSGLGALGGEFGKPRQALKHEVTEMALLEMPPALRDVGVTVMDGPFFSAMPYPAKGLHSLSHVRYTPHFSWMEDGVLNPYEVLERYAKPSRAGRMQDDAARYLPAIRDARYVENFFEIKTLLVKNEVDDGRPILLEKHASLAGAYSILGGKLDNVYDVLAHIDPLIAAERHEGQLRAS